MTLPFLGNLFSYGILQFVNYLLPLVTIPYVVRVLGVEEYGLISFVSAFANYFIMITDYGFNNSAVREISRERNKKDKLELIFNSVLSTKIFLLVVSCIIYFIFFFFVIQDSHQHLIYYCAFISVVGISISPQWYFQGIEKIKYYTGLSALFRGLALVAIFIYVKSVSDGWKYILINSISMILVGTFGIITILIKYKIRLRPVDSKLVACELKKGFPLFLSSVGVNLYTNTNIFILGILSPGQAVGYYAAADKLRGAIQGIYYPFNQSLFPHLSMQFKNSIQDGFNLIKKILKHGSIIGIIFCTLTLLFAEPIIQIIFSDRFLGGIITIRIMMIIPFVVFYSNLFGIQIMLNFHLDKEFTKIIWSGAIICMVLSLIFVPYLQDKGSAIVFLMTECLITILTAVNARKIYKDNLSKVVN